MAYIDKMHFSKKDIPAFYEYLKSIDDDFRTYFPNASSILNYTYYDMQCDEKRLSEWAVDDDIPVSNFPTIIDKWLAHREDLPKIIKEQLEFQYSDGSVFTDPIYKECHKEISHKFKVTKWTKCNGRRMTKPVKFWSFEPIDGMWRWYNNENVFVDEEYVTPDLIGKDFHWGSSTYKFKSIKSLFRYLKKHGFPKGTKIKIFDWRYFISEIEVEFI